MPAFAPGAILIPKYFGLLSRPFFVVPADFLCAISDKLSGMSIHDTFEIDNSGEVVRHPYIKRYFLVLVVILVGALSFGLGRLSSQSRPSGVKIEYDPALIDGTSTKSAQASTDTSISQTSTVINTEKGGGRVFASSKGTRYYYEGCRNTISDKNKVYFNSASEAEAAGYTLAANCTPR